jgi:large subunit ribosomal protein L2
MATHLGTQKRGRGSPKYRTPGHRYYGNISYGRRLSGMGQVVALLHDAGRRSLVVELLLDDGRTTVPTIAPEGMRIGDKVNLRTIDSYEKPEVFEYDNAIVTTGSVLPLSMVPDGTTVFNLELHPYDGGKLGRTSGAGILVVGHDEITGSVSVKLSSKVVRPLDPRCRATIGVCAGGGRTEKPFKKAGYKFYAMHARGQVWPRTRGTAMSAYDHPHGGKSMGKPTTIARNAPAGQKVGLIAASRAGRRRGKKIKAEETK